MHHSSRHTWFSVAIPLALAVAFTTSPALAADGVATLGSPPPEDKAPPSQPVDTDPMDGLLDYAACMREHEIEMPDPQAGGDGAFVMEFEGPAEGSGDLPEMGSLEDVMGSEFIAADEACSHHLGAMVSDHDPAQDAELIEQLLAHAECMREHGVDMPDPVMSGGAISLQVIDTGAGDELRAAEEACRNVLPFGDDGFDLPELED